MAKSNLFGNGGSLAKLPMIAEKSPVFTKPGSVFRRGDGGILPERGSRAQLDLVTQLLGSGMQSVQQSGSPLIALLAPLVGGAVGSRTEGLYKTAQAGRDQEAVDQLLSAMGGGGTTGAPMSAIPGLGVPPTTQQSIRNQALESFGGPTKAAAVAMDAGQNYAQSTGATGIPQTDEVSKYIMEAAAARGIDPNTALAVARSEGLNADPREAWQSSVVKNGKRERSYGPFQLYIDGGLGNQFMKSTGLDPRDPSTWKQQVDFSLDHAGKNGWGAWYGARNTGIGNMDGIGGRTPAQANAARVAGGDFSTFAGAGQQGVNQDAMRTLAGLLTNPDVSEPIRGLAGSMIQQAMGQTQPMTPQQQVSLASSMLGLENAMRPPAGPTFRPATAEEASAYGATAGQIDTSNGRFYPASAGSGSAKEQQIARLMEGGIDRSTAVAISDGRYKVSRDPITGAAQIIDVASGQMVDASSGQSDVSVPTQPTVEAPQVDQPQPTSSMPDDVDFNQATGVSGFASNLANTLSDAVGLGLISPNNEKATQAMNNLSTNTMIALANGVAGRPSNYLLEQFNRLASQPNSVFQGEGRTRERLTQTRAMIASAIQENRDVLASGVTPQMQAEARQNIARMDRLLKDYDTVLEGFGRGGGNAEENNVEPWMTETDPATWTEEQMLRAEEAWGLASPVQPIDAPLDPLGIR